MRYARNYALGPLTLLRILQKNSAWVMRFAHNCAVFFHIRTREIFAYVSVDLIIWLVDAAAQYDARFNLSVTTHIAQPVALFTTMIFLQSTILTKMTIFSSISTTISLHYKPIKVMSVLKDLYSISTQQSSFQRSN